MSGARTYPGPDPPLDENGKQEDAERSKRSMYTDPLVSGARTQVPFDHQRGVRELRSRKGVREYDAARGRACGSMMQS